MDLIVNSISKYGWLYLIGTRNTLLLAFLSVIWGILVGTLLAVMKLSKRKVLSVPANIYIEIIRGTPVFLQLMIIYFGLPLIGIKFPNLWFTKYFPEFMAALIAMGINSSAYVAEIIRAGINSIDKGQTEAARSLGMTEKMSMRLIILPQAFKNILPALCNEFVTVIKETAIVSVIGYMDLMYSADQVRIDTFKVFEPLLVAGGVYFVLTFTTSRLIARLEKRWARSDA